MLTAMEIPVTAGPWLVLGVVLGVLLPALAALAVVLLRRRAAPDRSPPPPEPDVDDLPGFLESPPGSLPAPASAATAWPALSAPPAPAATPPPPPGDPGVRGALVAMAVTAVVLVGVVAAVAAAGTDDRGRGSRTAGERPATEPGDVSAELTFDGIVLERHAVGVTVAYPQVLVTVRDGRATAEVEFVPFNCLRDSAPDDPVAAGCTRTAPEHAMLAEPELRVRGEGEGLRVSGAFPTVRRRNGSAPEATGRIYELAVAVAPRDGTADAGRQPATGELALGDERVRTRSDGSSTITYGG